MSDRHPAPPGPTAERHSEPESATSPRPIRLVERRLPPDLDETMIRKVVYGFYEAVRADSLLGPVFDAAIPAPAWPAHLERMTAFWSSVALGTGGYEGRPVPKHVGLPGLGDDHFARWLALFEATTSRLASAESAAILQEYAVRIAHSLRLALAFHRGEDTTRIRRMEAGGA